MARLASAVDTAVDGILVFDHNAEIIVFNKACERLFGFRATELLGRSIDTIFPSGSALIRQADVGYLRSKQRKMVGPQREVNGRRKDGGELPLEISLSETTAAEGPLFIAVLRNLTRRNATDRRLRRLHSDLLRLTRATVMEEMGVVFAHELNQPLTALLLYLQAATRVTHKEGSDRLPAAIHDLIDKATNEAERAAGFVRHVRKCIAPQETARKRVDLNSLVGDAIDVALLGDAGDVPVIRDFEQGLPRLLVDPLQVQLIVTNLVRNALDGHRTNKHAWIDVVTRRHGSEVTVIVSSSGLNIGSDVLPYLFGPLASSTNASLSVGLIVARKIAQNHGGDLTMEAGGDGCEARFTLRLPS